MGSRLVSINLVVALHLAIVLLLMMQVRKAPVPVELPLQVGMVEMERPPEPEIPPAPTLQPVLAPPTVPRLPLPQVPVVAASPMVMQVAVTQAVAAPPAVAASPEPVVRKTEGVPPDYLALLMSHLAKAKRYPQVARRLRQQGIVHVRFTISRAGRVVEASLDMRSGYEALDVEAIELLRRATPLPRLPDDMPDLIELVIPIEFSLR